MALRRAVVSLLNTPAGLFPWYEAFPLAIGEKLAAHGIEHVLGYKEYLANASVPATPRLAVHDIDAMPHGDWLRAHLEPVLARFDQVIVHTHSYAFGSCRLWELMRGRANRRWYATSHRTPRPASAWHAVPRRLLQVLRRGYPDRVFGCSAASAAALRGMYLPSRVGVLLNGRLAGEDLNRFPPREVPRRALFAGRLVAEKGVWSLLEAAAVLVARYPDFELVVVGMGPEEAAMRDWIAARGLASRVRMTGYQPDLAPYYAQADFVIMPSDPALVSEGLPLVALEAKGWALPLLYTASGGLPETQLEGQTGLLVDPFDAAGLAAAAMALMDDIPRYHDMRSAIAVERQRWSLDAMAERYLVAYLAGFASM
ncbi:MAG TPA: glycosyltransferase family 4 protein [Rhodanobacteraceae bacterium]|nr:glycosyltransferase family 4 protein [Rhodanobacteraceae bacterium]